jgi:spore germination protein
LAGIAARHKVRPDAIMRRNKLSAPDRILLGQTLIIPDPDIVSAKPAQAPPASQAPQAIPDNSPASRTEKTPLQKGEQRHVVQSGDTLNRIATQYKVRPEAIMQRNNLSSPDRVLLGIPLIIPTPVR